jgi:hypothetical protein
MIHYSNPKCDVCGCRHSDGHVAECLECVLRNLADLRVTAADALQRCVNAMTGVLDVDAGLSIQWMVLRRAREDAQRVIADECED